MKKIRFARKQKRDKSAENQRLALLAKELGTAMLMVLINDYDFSKEQANEILGKVLDQAKTNRLMITTTTVLAAYDILNKNE
ncbi:MAG: hypothetical protein ACYSW7_11525 [Planctomycetota bacterium]|jgi:hypothetical protein